MISLNWVVERVMNSFTYTVLFVLLLLFCIFVYFELKRRMNAEQRILQNLPQKDQEIFVNGKNESAKFGFALIIFAVGKVAADLGVSWVVVTVSTLGLFVGGWLISKMFQKK